MSDIRLVFKHKEELLKLNNKGINNPNLKVGRISEQTPHQRYTDGK
jgi:hypothetical protein